MSDRAPTISSFTPHALRVMGNPPVKDESDPKNLDIHIVDPGSFPEGGLVAWCTVIGV